MSNELENEMVTHLLERAEKLVQELFDCLFNPERKLFRILLFSPRDVGSRATGPVALLTVIHLDENGDPQCYFPVAELLPASIGEIYSKYNVPEGEIPSADVSVVNVSQMTLCCANFSDDNFYLDSSNSVH